MLCLCWRKKTQKDDLLGLDGSVTQKNPDENVNHLPSAIIRSVPEGAVSAASGSASAPSERPVVVNNPRRSLPDIPSEGEIRTDSDVVAYELNGDNLSDLYASVEPYRNSIAKRHTLPNGIDACPTTSRHDRTNGPFSPYALVKEHPYDELQGKTEHPYARVQRNSDREQDGNSSGEGAPRMAAALRKEQLLGEVATSSRSRRCSLQGSAGSDIPAASAVSGGIAANQDLPYMTPPINQPNFSGDSQDSSKGYTSISVREPLANIRARTKASSKEQTDADPHYSTVSDDSDDVYTTIQDPNNPIYTSGSETYAQIRPPQLTVAAEVSADADVHTDEPTVTQPPDAGGQRHSRQASSSSSAGNLSSPKPEKRQANSPLPPPPPSSSNPPTGPDKTQASRNVDDMYAKVQKGKRKTEQDEATWRECPQYPPSEVGDGGSEGAEHDYETLRKSPKGRDAEPGYERLKPRGGVEEDVPEPNYDTINGPDSIPSPDPGYELLKCGGPGSASAPAPAPSEVDPNYEELRHGASCAADATDNNGYSVVRKRLGRAVSAEDVRSRNSISYEREARDPSTDEPNYESMPSESLSGHNYAVLRSTTGSESDPNYESVKYLDVTALGEPPYERLQDEDSSRTGSNASALDVISGHEGSKTDPDYETVAGETEDGPRVRLDGDYNGIVQV